MKHYKKPDGSVWGFEDDGSQDKLITKDMAPLTQTEETQLFSNTEPSRRDAIPSELAAIDLAAIRPARAIALAVAQGKNVASGSEDLTKLTELEARAVALRAELAGLKD